MTEVPPSARHRQLALIVVIATVLAYATVAAYANVQLPRVDSFVPIVMAITFAADLVVTVLFCAQFAARGSRALLVLASGYLFSSLIVIAHVLTFPGAFSPTGLFGAGPQSAAYLSISWRWGLSLAFLVYACFIAAGSPTVEADDARRRSIAWAALIISLVVIALTWLAVAGDGVLPRLLVDGKVSDWGHAANGIIALTSGLAMLVLWRRGRSVLDLWLTVAAFALMLEGTTIALFVTARFTIGFYALRVTSLAVSKVVLVAVLWQTVRLYAGLQISYRELRRERANRLTSAEAVVASIAHEIRQPLTNINLLASAGHGSLDRASPDVSAAKKHFEEIEEDAFRVSEVFDGFLRFFRGGKQQRQAVDINALTLEAIRSLRRELDEHHVTTSTQLVSDLPLVQGHAGQLREVLLNLLQNAIEAMAPTVNRPRLISIATSHVGAGAVVISLRDTGPGIKPQAPTSIFDPFVTTKTKGTGLGLAICKMIVEQHGGELSATSGNDGGAQFEITLPVGAYDRAIPHPSRKETAAFSPSAEAKGDHVQPK